ncbi:hypothetical protein HZB06_03300 [Candidatus Wolfebacteria bacterium]|nr:hypothetical protein [Candidatus Wolfebacteria bacterium]
MFFVSYLFKSFFLRLIGFFQHWYLNSFKIYSHFIVSLLEKLDKAIAFKITLRYFFQPLFGDYTFLGYILGIFFRFWRLVFGAVAYSVIIAIAAFFYFIWLAAPAYMVFKILTA